MRNEFLNIREFTAEHAYITLGGGRKMSFVVLKAEILARRCGEVKRSVLHILGVRVVRLQFLSSDSKLGA